MTSSPAVEPAPRPAVSPDSWRRRLRTWLRPLGAKLMPLLALPVLRVLASSWTTTVLGKDHLEKGLDADGCLFALWHGRMLVGIPSQVQHEMSVLVSPSRDGALIDPILRGFRYGTVRGSTGKAGARALRELLTRLREGGRIVITPDGPRGPRHSMNEGLAWMAAATGFPVLPVGLAADRAWHTRSWDHFTIPKWRAKIVVGYGPPMTLARNASKEERAEFSTAVRAAMMDQERAAFRALGVAPDFADDSA